MSAINLEQQIATINQLEQFIFGRIRFSFTSPYRSHPEILALQNTTDPSFIKIVIYALHDRGELIESEEEQTRRLSYAPIIIDDLQYNKLEFHYLPKHYDEVLTAIRDFYTLVIPDSSSITVDVQKDPPSDSKIKKAFQKPFQIYAQHFDCNNLNQSIAHLDSNQQVVYKRIIPQDIIEKIEPIQLAFLAKEHYEIACNVYLNLTQAFISTHKDHPEILWETLGIRKEQIKQFEIAIHEHLNCQSKPITRAKKILSNFKKQRKGHIDRLYMLIDYINEQIAPKFLECYFKECILLHEQKKGHATSLINHTDILLGKRTQYTKQEKNHYKQTLKYLHDNQPQQPINDEIEILMTIFEPISLHDSNSLIAFKDKSTRFKSDEKQSIDKLNDEYKNTLIQIQNSEKNAIGHLIKILNTDNLLSEHPNVQTRIESLLLIHPELLCHLSDT